MKEVRIDEDEYRRRIIPWYKEHIDLSGLTMVSPELRELNLKLGLDYLCTDHDRNAVRFKVVDEQLFFLAKIKFGI